MYETTWYFRNDVLREAALPDGPYLTMEMCIAVIQKPIRQDVQDDGRLRFWARVPQLGDRVLRVVTLDDGRTIHNAFPDRGFRQ